MIPQGSTLVPLIGALLFGLSSGSFAESPTEWQADNNDRAPTLRPLPWLGPPCGQGRLPTLSGGWAIGCGNSDAPQRAQHLETGERIEWDPPQGDWGLSEGAVIDLQARSFTKIGAAPQPLTPISSALHAPPVSKGETLVFSGPRGIEIMALGERERQIAEGSTPAPWYPPSMNKHGVFWVELHDGKEEIWWLRSGASQAEQLASGKEPLRHVIAQGDHVAWMGDTVIHLNTLSNGKTVEFSGEVHTNDSLALSEGLLCYEASTDGDIDIFCSNGLHLDRPQNQRKPRLWKHWLLFQEGQQVLLYGPIK